MSNILQNGTVLPSGLLGVSHTAMGGAFRKTYQNYALRVGIVLQSYAISDPNNINKKVPEYDVMTFEQDGDQGSTTIIYKRCIFNSSFGSVADFFEANLRKLTKKTTPGPTPSPSGQDGAIVLLLCLNGMSDKAVIIGSLSHPDRPTTLVDDSPRLAGEYNGVAIAVNPDGSTSLTWNGPTNNDGTPVTAGQTPTTIQIATDGSLAISTSQNVTINCTNATVTATNIATVEGKTVKLGANATEAVIKGNTFQQYFNQHTHPTAVGPSGPPIMPMPNSNLSTKVVTE